MDWKIRIKLHKIFKSGTNKKPTPFESWLYLSNKEEITLLLLQQLLQQ